VEVLDSAIRHKQMLNLKIARRARSMISATGLSSA
jgi:hypothetical protein